MIALITAMVAYLTHPAPAIIPQVFVAPRAELPLY